ncbi:MAG TPA: GNAT family N-acetyltransferase [Terriglobales bacterium]|nr:GNAT family N-acetyltransferase [Terriglobales bacterium]
MRLATVADAELLLDFMRDYYAFDSHHYDRQAARTALLGLLKNPVFGLVWLILDGNIPVGYIVLCFGYSLEYHGRDAFVDEFYLVESHRRRNWGRLALEFIREQARLHHVRAIHLEVVRRNTGAMEFYRKLGFRDHGHYLMSLPVS